MVPNVTHFLLVFDRTHGRLLSSTPFNDASEALAQRFRDERLHQHNPDIEIVVLTAESKSALRRTHARYFESLTELASVRTSRTAGAVVVD
jgi:hypothetical protein